MFNANRPSSDELPSTAKLLKSTGIAAVIAGALLVAFVLPAEYGVDPTRVGSVLGLTEMGRIKAQLAEEAEADAAADAAGANVSAPAAAPSPTSTVEAPATASASRSDETVITLAPDQGAEIKLVMKEGDVARFTWTSSGGRVNFDTHADRPGLSYHGYEKGSLQSQSGQLTAAFTGSHGWFWRNRTGETVTITLRTEGDYSEIKRVV
jgi:hypothetical protein